MQKITSQIWSGVFLVMLFGFMLFRSLAYPYTISGGRPGAGFFPVWLCSIILVFSTIYIYQVIKGNEKNIPILPTGKRLRDLLFVFGSMLLFIVVSPYTGFVFASSLFLFLLFYYEGYKWYLSLLMSIGASVLLFLLFYGVLGVALPVNQFGW